MNNNVFDVAVIGGGPAGMMAAISAAKEGKKVILLEKNPSFGRKLFLTGNGRCNITHALFDIDELCALYGRNGRFLQPAFSCFGPKKVMEFFGTNGLKLTVEEGDRVFPLKGDAKDVLEILVKLLKKYKVAILTDFKVTGFDISEGKIKSFEGEQSGKPQEIFADNFILAMGGKSYPVTGSSGDGYDFAKKMGHKITQLIPALTPVKIFDSFIKDLQGITVSNVEVKFLNDKNKALVRGVGDILFTHFGLSSPLILDLSRNAAEYYDDIRKVVVDFFYEKDLDQLNAFFIDLFCKNQNRNLINILKDFAPERFAAMILKIVGIDGGIKANSVSREERLKLVNIFKNFEMDFGGFMGFDFAFITKGGVSLKEIDPKTMKSRLIENLYFAGEIIDIDGPTGGYNLQIAWATGYLAGKGQYQA